MEKIYFINRIIDTAEGVMIYAKRRMSEYAAQLAQKESDPKRKAELQKSLRLMQRCRRINQKPSGKQSKRFGPLNLY
jgi:hypothetical protein